MVDLVNLNALERVTSAESSGMYSSMPWFNTNNAIIYVIETFENKGRYEDKHMQSPKEKPKRKNPKPKHRFRVTRMMYNILLDLELRLLSANDTKNALRALPGALPCLPCVAPRYSLHVLRHLCPSANKVDLASI